MKKGLIIGKGWLGSRLEKYLEKQFLRQQMHALINAIILNKHIKKYRK